MKKIIFIILILLIPISGCARGKIDVNSPLIQTGDKISEEDRLLEAIAIAELAYEQAKIKKFLLTRFDTGLSNYEEEVQKLNILIKQREENLSTLLNLLKEENK